MNRFVPAEFRPARLFLEKPAWKRFRSGTPNFTDQK